MMRAQVASRDVTVKTVKTMTLISQEASRASLILRMLKLVGLTLLMVHLIFALSVSLTAVLYQSQKKETSSAACALSLNFPRNAEETFVSLHRMPVRASTALKNSKTHTMRGSRPIPESCL